MQDFSSIGVLNKLRAKDSQVPFLLATEYHTIETALEAIKNGAYGYVVKPFFVDDLRIKAERALMERRLKASLDRAYCILLVLAVSAPLLFVLGIVLGLVWAM